MQYDLNPTSNIVYKFTHSIANDYIYTNNRLDLFQYPLSIEHPHAHTLLNDEELEKANRFYFQKHKRRYIMARATLRLILSRYLEINPKDIEFTCNAYGKPTLLNEPSLQFNLSHSGELALLAIGKTHPVGIDLEFLSARPYEGIAQEMFSINENQALSNTDERLKPLTFFHIWAQKEALIKACGLGLSYPTKQFDVSALLPTNQTIWDELHQITWKMVSFIPTLGCAAALCHHLDIQDIRYFCLKTLSF